MEFKVTAVYCGLGISTAKAEELTVCVHKLQALTLEQATALANAEHRSSASITVEAC